MSYKDSALCKLHNFFGNLIELWGISDHFIRNSRDTSNVCWNTTFWIYETVKLINYLISIMVSKSTNAYVFFLGRIKIYGNFK